MLLLPSLYNLALNKLLDLKLDLISNILIEPTAYLRMNLNTRKNTSETTQLWQKFEQVILGKNFWNLDRLSSVIFQIFIELVS